MVSPGPDRTAVAALFNADARNWDAIYHNPDVFSVIHQLRRDICAGWAAEVAAPARVLEVGCGTGLTAIQLARLGHRVTATDAAAAMLERATANAESAGPDLQLAFERADVHSLPFASQSFDLVVALGVVPWLEDPTAAVSEMARVLAPGGRLIANCDNRLRLNVILDPRYSPWTSGVRRLLHRVRRRTHATGAAEPASETVRHSPSDFDALLGGLGLSVERRRCYGFGPFTLLGQPVAAGATGVRLNNALQRLADGGVGPFARTGAQYIVLARRA